MGVADLAAKSVTRAKLDDAVGKVVDNALRRFPGSQTTAAVYHLEPTVPSGGIYTYDASAHFSALEIAMAQVNESSSSLVANSCIISGSKVLIGVRKLADGTAYAGACRVKLLVIGTPKG